MTKTLSSLKNLTSVILHRDYFWTVSLSQWNNRVLGDGVVVMNLNRLDTFFRESITNGSSTKNT